MQGNGKRAFENAQRGERGHVAHGKTDDGIGKGKRRLFRGLRTIPGEKARKIKEKLAYIFCVCYNGKQGKASENGFALGGYYD